MFIIRGSFGIRGNREWITFKKSYLINGNQSHKSHLIDSLILPNKIVQLSTGFPHGPLYPMPIPIFAIAISPKRPFSCSYLTLLCLPTSGSKSHSVFCVEKNVDESTYQQVGK